jgi:soluble lytic murein transglycosylase-like protein
LEKAGLNMCVKKVYRTAAAGIILLLFFHTPVSADIYRYVDKNGVWHFTNIYTDTRYRLYLATTHKSSAEYIKEYKGIIRQASKRFGLDPSLIKAVIKAESDFDREAVSRVGAQGLMQLMPQTADAMAVGDPFDPEENIFGGARYLSQLLKRFNNDKLLALAAYNAGPQAVETHKGVPPYSETRTFIKRVMSYYNSFRAKAD